MRDIYILLKDTPTAKAGQKYVKYKDCDYYVVIEWDQKIYNLRPSVIQTYPKYIVENEKEWFEKEEKSFFERPEIWSREHKQSVVNECKVFLEDHGFIVRPIPGDKRNSFFWQEYGNPERIKKEEIQSVEEKAYGAQPPEKTFTLKDMEECWIQARRPSEIKRHEYRFNNIDEYLKTLK